ncbi:MAG: PspC domain-containing protein [Actinomycetota bacterium]
MEVRTISNMENTPPDLATGGSSQTTAPPAPFYRPREGRVVAGVAAAIADRFGIPRWVARLTFAILILGDGAGLLLYLAGWLLIPTEGETESIGKKWANQAHSTRPWVGIALIVVASAILFSTIPFFDGGLVIPVALLVVGILLYRGDLHFTPDPARKAERTMTTTSGADTASLGRAEVGTSASTQLSTPRPAKPRPPASPLGRLTIGVAIIGLGLLAVIDRLSPMIDAHPRHYFALAIAILGLGVLVGTLFGRARWLIPFGLLIIPAVTGAAIVESAEGSWRTPELIRPSSFAGVDGFYERSAGELVIDLRDLPWNGETIELAAEVGAGTLHLIVPAGVGIDGQGEVGVGELRTDGQNQGGFGLSVPFNVEGERGTIFATLDVGVGRLEVDARQRFDDSPEGRLRSYFLSLKSNPVEGANK